MNPPPQDAAAFLRAARMFRANGDVCECREFAHAARHKAITDGDGETVYRSLACLGHLHYYRAEYEESYSFYKQALREAQAWDVRQWIAPAYHDCWLSYSHIAEQDARLVCEYGAGMADGWSPFPRGAWRFVFDHATCKVDSDPARERAQFLAHAATTAEWHTINRRTTGGDQYAAYQAKFERMIVCASMVQGFGGAGLLSHWRRSLNLFDMAAQELGTYEGYGLSLIACASGSWAVGERITALSLINRAMAVADRRGEREVIAAARKVRDGWDVPPGLERTP